MYMHTAQSAHYLMSTKGTFQNNTACCTLDINKAQRMEDSNAIRKRTNCDFCFLCHVHQNRHIVRLVQQSELQHVCCITAEFNL